MSTLAAVLDVFRERITVSRVELAEATGLTQATMTHAVRRLMALGFVHEVGRAPSARGTPRRLLELQPGACYSVGVQFDRFIAIGVLVDLAGRVVARMELPGTGDRGPEPVMAEYAARIEAMLRDSGVPRAAVLGIGLATYGPQDREAGVLRTPQPTAAWQDHPLTAELEAGTGLPVTVENDATAAGIGVQTQGSAAASFAVVFMSGGIGSGVILDGLPYRGVTSNGLELGHISVDANGSPCGCGNRGCLDTLAGPYAVSALARERPGLRELLGSEVDQYRDFRSVGRAALAGDTAAAELVADSARLVAAGTVTLVNLFDVGRVVLTGPAFADLGPIYRDAIQEVLDRSVFMRHVHTVAAELAANPVETAAVGAAAVVVRNLLESSGLRKGAEA